MDGFGGLHPRTLPSSHTFSGTPTCSPVHTSMGRDPHFFLNDLCELTLVGGDNSNHNGFLNGLVDLFPERTISRLHHNLPLGVRRLRGGATKERETMTGKIER